MDIPQVKAKMWPTQEAPQLNSLPPQVAPSSPQAEPDTRASKTRAAFRIGDSDIQSRLLSRYLDEVKRLCKAQVPFESKKWINELRHCVPGYWFVTDGKDLEAERVSLIVTSNTDLYQDGGHWGNKAYKDLLIDPKPEVNRDLKAEF
jgi:hypothetical protein